MDISDEAFLAQKQAILVLLRSAANYDNWWDDAPGSWKGKRHLVHWSQDVLCDLEGKPRPERGSPVCD